MVQFFSTLTVILLLRLSGIADEHYLLPEHNSDLLHTLKSKINRAGNLTIISSELKSPSLSKSIEKALLKGAHFDLFTTDIQTAAYYAKYKNTFVKVPVTDQLTNAFSLHVLLIDKSDVCFSSLAFNDALMSRQMGEVICTTDQEEIDFALHIEKRLAERFEAYNR